MIQVDADQAPDLSHQIHEQLRRDDIPYVQTINIKDESIAPGFRAQTHDLESIQLELSKFLEREHARDIINKLLKIFVSQESTVSPSVKELRENIAHNESPQLVASSAIRSMLNNIAEQLSDQTLRAKFTNDKLSDREAIEVLKYAPSEQRLDFVRSLYSIANTDRSLRHFIRENFDNVIRYTSTAERVQLIKEWLADTKNADAGEFIASVCQASSSFSQLASVVNRIGIQAFLDAKDPWLGEYVAHVKLGTQLRSLSFPYTPSQIANGADIVENLKTVQNSLETAIRICKNDSEVAQTLVARDFIRTAENNLFLLREDSAHTNGPEDLRRLSNLISSKARLEFRYGIRLTYDDGLSVESSPARRWSERDIHNINMALEQTSEGRILLTPFLSEIRRVATLGENTLGARFPDGIIKIADLAIDNLVFSLNECNGKDSLQVVLTHEMGHAIQLGYLSPGTIKPPGKGLQIDEGDPSYNFEEFIALSGWRAVEADRYQFNATKTKVTLDGQEYNLDIPVSHQGESIVLTESHDRLYSYNSSASFSNRGYSRTDPWEDFAEAYAEYTLLPERLVRNAPQKFWHLEQEFRRYENDSRLMKTLQENLERDRKVRHVDLKSYVFVERSVDSDKAA